MQYELLIDLHKGGARQGPGSEEHTKMALVHSGLLESAKALKVADIGCGTGASTLVLAKNLDAEIIAVDLFPEFLNALLENAKRKGLAKKINTVACRMSDLPFAYGSFDAIWTEGAIYNMGFLKGIAYFKRFLKRGGILAVSEITWLTQSRPDEIASHWNSEYPEIAEASAKIKLLENQGYVLKGYFPLPECCWIDNYYKPLQSRFDMFLAKHDIEEAKPIVEAEIKEIELHKRYSKHYSYGFYIAQKASR